MEWRPVVDGCLGGIPGHQQLLTLRGIEQRQPTQRGVGSFDETRQQGPEVTHHAPRRGPLEDLGVVFERAPQTLGRRFEDQREVKLGGPGSHQDRAQREVRQVESVLALVLQDEQCLEERGGAQVPRRGQIVDQALEGHVLVVVGSQAGLAHPAQEVAEAQAGQRPGTEHQDIDEESDETLDLGPVAVRHRGADGEVLLPAVAMEQGLEGGQQHHERGGTVASRQGLDLAAALVTQGDLLVGTGVPAERRTGSVGRQLEVGNPGQLRTPVAQLLFEHLPLQPLPLTLGEVGVLNRQGGQSEGLGCHRRGLRPGSLRSPAMIVGEAIERPQLVGQDLARPGVGHHVVEGEQELVAVRRQTQHDRLEERRPGEIENMSGHALPPARHRLLALRLRPLAEIDQLHLDG